MTAEKDHPETGRSTDASLNDSHGGGPNLKQTVAERDLRGRRAGTFDFQRRYYSGIGTRRGDNTLRRDHRSLGKRRAPRGDHRVVPDLPIEHRVEVHPTGKLASILPAGREAPSAARGVGDPIRILRSPYFTNIGILLLLYTVSLQTCFDVASIISRSFVCLGAKAAFAATVDLVVNEWMPSIQAFLAGRIVRWIGLSLLVALLPAFTIIRSGMLAKLRSLGKRAFVRLRGVQSMSRPDAREQTPPPS